MCSLCITSCLHTAIPTPSFCTLHPSTFFENVSYTLILLSLIAEFCYQSLYILAFTSGLTNAGSNDDAYVEMRLKTGETRLIRLYNRPGDDYMRYKGDLWKISLSSFGFNDKCITRSDIDNLALVEGGHDGWNIESVVTFLKRESYYRLLSQDFNVYRWLDGNGELSHLRFDLNLV